MSAIVTACIRLFGGVTLHCLSGAAAIQEGTVILPQFSNTNKIIFL